MAFCTKCGATIPDAASFCQQCGGVQQATAAHGPVAQSQGGLSENVAAMLSYVLGWLTGLIFYLIDHRPYVRFHAAQSLVTFGGLHIIRAVIGISFGLGWWWGGWGHFAGAGLLLGTLGLFTCVLWIVCMVKAYQGLRFKLPI